MARRQPPILQAGATSSGQAGLLEECQPPMRTSRIVRTPQSPVELMHRDGGTNDEVGRCEAPSHPPHFMQASQTTQVQSSLSRIVVTPTVVLVQIARRLHDKIR